MEGHKFSFGAVNCTASVAAGARATVPETECVEGVGGELVSACMTHSHGLLHGILCIIPSNKRFKKPPSGVSAGCIACRLTSAVRWVAVGGSRGLCKGNVMAFLKFDPAGRFDIDWGQLGHDVLTTVFGYTVSMTCNSVYALSVLGTGGASAVALPEAALGCTALGVTAGYAFNQATS